MNRIFAAIALSTALFAALPVPEQMRADFNQTVLNSENNRTLRYSGHVAVKVPDRAKWIYETPVKKTICLQGNRAWVIEPELEQATLYRLDRTIPLLAILEHAKNIDKTHYIAHYNGVAYDIYVDGGKHLNSVGYTDELGNRVTLKFSRVDTSKIDDSLLECDIPEDYDIIDGRF
ncbi:LolA-like outer membrane lipoprotein chaperone [Hydrogenimonas urashimensis]|uniref:LolA-like outer membrane lipoprotein chaperone n=1 Tax=Hydrogenimonas urashimensis TaxID=2740515 RepID=UPI0019156448|nr:LolA-like outer membrane lipoprotein chaperone [Hydrogenimonas urashimensis]